MDLRDFPALNLGKDDNNPGKKPERLHDPDDNEGIRTQTMKQKTDKTGKKANRKPLEIRGFYFLEIFQRHLEY